MKIVPPFVRSPYNYDVMEVSNETGLKCEDVSLAVQSAAEEVDINTIVRRFGLTGKLPEDVRAPSYGDFVGVRDYHDAMNAIRQAEESFDVMPASVRARFGNDAGLFVDFCSDPKNAKEFKELGLLSREAYDRVVKEERDAAIAAAKLDPASKVVPEKSGT